MLLATLIHWLRLALLFGWFVNTLLLRLVHVARSHYACVRFAGFGNSVWYRSACPLLMLSFLTGPAESLRVRVRAFPLRFSASSLGLGSHRHPPPPNNSFKPTPCRGIGCVLCATLARIRRPATGRLNSSVRRQKNVRFQPRITCSAAPLIFAPLPSLAAALVVFSHHAMLRIVRLARSRFTSVAFVRFGNSGWCGQCSATDTVASETPS